MRQSGWDLALIAVSLEWGANGLAFPPEAMARAAAAYDAAVAAGPGQSAAEEPPAG